MPTKIIETQVTDYRIVKTEVQWSGSVPKKVMDYCQYLVELHSPERAVIKRLGNKWSVLFNPFAKDDHRFGCSWSF